MQKITLQSHFFELEGTNCYCSSESAERLRSMLASLPLDAVHLIGTGDYHYISLFWLERISEPFSLLLLDNHPDDQSPAFDPDILSCGSWVAKARLLPMLKSDCWIQNPGDPLLLPEGLPVYVSIDLDVLSPEFAHTDWSQGVMTLAQLSETVRRAIRGRRVIGVDICGGLSEEKGASDADKALNESTAEAVYQLFRE